MNELTESQLLLLDNFMYISGSSGVPKGTTVNEIIETMYTNDLSKDDLSGGITVEQAYEILNEIKSDSTLCNLTIQASLDTDGVRASCFVDDYGNATVTFRGTGGTYEAWNDNLLGEYLEDTPCQRCAADFINNACAGYDNITVTGHSKGGNMAQYCTVVLGDKIDRCVSYDGQGFNNDFLDKYSNEISDATGKITSISCNKDYVNILLNPIAGETKYLETLEDAGAHSSWELYLKNKGLVDEQGQYNATVEQDPLMKALMLDIDRLTDYLDKLPDNKEQAVADDMAALVGLVMAAISKKMTWEDIGDYLTDRVHSKIKSKIPGWALKFIQDNVLGYSKKYTTTNDLHDGSGSRGNYLGKSAVFTMEASRMMNTVKEMEKMENQLKTIYNQLNSMVLKSEIVELSLSKNISQIGADVGQMKEDLEQLRLTLDGCIKEYSTTEKNIIIVGSTSHTMDSSQDIRKVYS